MADEPHDEIIPTSTLVAPEGTESSPSTTSAVNDYDYNEQGHPRHNTNKDGSRIVPTKAGADPEGGHGGQMTPPSRAEYLVSACCAWLNSQLYHPPINY